MSDVPKDVYGRGDFRGVPGLCEGENLPVSAPVAISPVERGWQCPVCESVYSPRMMACTHCLPKCAMHVPRHIINAVEADVKHAKTNRPQGERIVRGTFVVHYIEQLLDAVRPKK